jgi:hypothetical protein
MRLMTWLWRSQWIAAHSLSDNWCHKHRLSMAFLHMCTQKFKPCGVWHCHWVSSLQCFAGHGTSIFRVEQSKKTGVLDPKDEETVIIQHVGNYSPSDTASHCSRLEGSAAPLWEPQVLDMCTCWVRKTGTSTRSRFRLLIPFFPSIT